MADADIPITAGTGTKVDTRTVGAGVDEHRQVIVVGDPVTATDVATVTAANGMKVDVTRVTGIVNVDLAIGTAGATTSVSQVVTTGTSLIAANAARVAMTVYNDSTSGGTLFVLAGAGVESATVYTVQIPSGGFWEVPMPMVGLALSGHWSVAGTGAARITAVT